LEEGIGIEDSKLLSNPLHHSLEAVRSRVVFEMAPINFRMDEADAVLAS